MKYGFVLPGGDAATAADLANEAEAVGWDGVFYPDAISIETEQHPAGEWHDPWIVLAAMAMRTERVRIGTMLTPLSRRRPWKVARETVTLDHLSKGRLILPVGFGAAEDDAGFYKVGEAMERKVRAELLDESLEILAGLWTGQPFGYSGRHYRFEPMTFLPPPVQSPRIPIWVVGVWPKMKSMRRVLQWDGLLPARMNDKGRFGEVRPPDIAAMRAFVEEHRSQNTPFDIVMEGETPGADRAEAAAKVRPFADAGATWWLESMWSAARPDLRARIRQGPPAPIG